MTEPNDPLIQYNPETILEGADPSVDPTPEQLARGAAGDLQGVNFSADPAAPPAPPAAEPAGDTVPSTASLGEANPGQTHVREVTDSVAAKSVS